MTSYSSTIDKTSIYINNRQNKKIRKTFIYLLLVIFVSIFAALLIAPYTVSWLDHGIFSWQLMFGISRPHSYLILILLLTLYLLGTSSLRSIFMRPSLARHGFLPVLFPQLLYLSYIYISRHDLTFRTLATGLGLSIGIQIIIGFCLILALFKPSYLKFYNPNCQ